MVRKENLQHIFFDLDDTIWDFEKNSERILSKLFEEKDLKNKLSTDFNTYFIAYILINIFQMVVLFVHIDINFVPNGIHPN